MCRNIKTLFNFEPPASEDEIHASALQFVRKLSGFNKPSQANAEALISSSVAGGSKLNSVLMLRHIFFSFSRGSAGSPPATGGYAKSCIAADFVIE